MMASSHPNRLAYAAWIAVCLIWGTTYLGIKVALETMPPLLMGGMRYMIAGALLLGALRLNGLPLPSRSSWPGLALLGFLFLGLGNGGVIWAEQTMPSGLTAVLVAMTPFWMVAIEAFLSPGTRISPRHIGGLIVGFCGIILLVWPDLSAGGAHTSAMVSGLIAMQVASFGWSLGSVYSRRHAREENALSAAGLEMLLGGACMLLAGSALGEWDRLGFNARSGAAFAYLIIVGAIGGFTAYIYALKHLTVSTVSLYAYINPVIAVALGSLLLAEPVDARILAAIAIILAGVALVQTAERGRASRKEGVKEAA